MQKNNESSMHQFFATPEKLHSGPILGPFWTKIFKKKFSTKT